MTLIRNYQKFAFGKRDKTGCLLLSGKNREPSLSGYQWSQSLFSFISVTSGDSEKCPICLSLCKTNKHNLFSVPMKILNLMFIGPCIIVITGELKTN